MEKFKELSKKFQLVYLYYPNNWNRYIDNKSFNWFLCSKKYLDPILNVYIIELANGSKFYDKTTGNTLYINSPNPIKLLLIDKKSELKYNILDFLKNNNLSGITTSDSFNKCNKTLPILCNIGFLFLPNILKSYPKQNNCELIRYAKSNYLCIKKKVKNFPTPSEIDDLLKKYSCSVICKVIYDSLIDL
jgi:hypothetical protein